MLKTLIFLITIPCIVLSRSAGDDFVFTGGTVAWHNRYGYTDFGEDRIEYTQNPLLRTQGLLLGKNFPLPFDCRVMMPFWFEYGVVKDGFFENVPLTNGTTPNLLLKSKMYHVALQPLVQMPLHAESKARPVASAGFGIHYTAFIEEFRPDDGQNIIVPDSYLEESKTLSFSIAGGGGMEVLFDSRFILSFNYMFRYWKPVRRRTSRDLFPLESIPYAERFLTHSVFIAILIPPVR